MRAAVRPVVHRTEVREVEHHAHPREVEPARRQVSREQNREVTAPEAVHGGLAIFVTHSAGQPAQRQVLERRMRPKQLSIEPRRAEHKHLLIFPTLRRTQTRGRRCRSVVRTDARSQTPRERIQLGLGLYFFFFLPLRTRVRVSSGRTRSQRLMEHVSDCKYAALRGGRERRVAMRNCGVLW